jgi:hypothetical protein
MWLEVTSLEYYTDYSIPTRPTKYNTRKMLLNLYKIDGITDVVQDRSYYCHTFSIILNGETVNFSYKNESDATSWRNNIVRKIEILHTQPEKGDVNGTAN